VRAIFADRRQARACPLSSSLCRTKPSRHSRARPSGVPSPPSTLNPQPEIARSLAAAMQPSLPRALAAGDAHNERGALSQRALLTGAARSNDDFLAYAELGIEQGAKLFDVYGRASARADDVTDIFLGTITTTSRMTRSTFGDTQLFFAHELMENDFRRRPDWLPVLDVETACGTADVDPTRPLTTPEHAAQRRSAHGCPFAPLHGGRHGSAIFSAEASAHGGAVRDAQCPYLRAQARQKALQGEEREELRAQKALQGEELRAQERLSESVVA
jgi:hypothetical protein